MTTTVIQAAEIRSASLDVLARLGVSEAEMQVSLGELDYLVELAQKGEVVPIDISDSAGGFGPSDLWVATVVPAVAAVIAVRSMARASDKTAIEAVEDIVSRVRSPRAQRELRRLLEAVLATDPLQVPTQHS